MKTLEYFIGGAFALIVLYLLLSQSQGAATLFSSFATGSSQIFKTLQGNG